MADEEKQVPHPKGPAETGEKPVEIAPGGEELPAAAGETEGVPQAEGGPADEAPHSPVESAAEGAAPMAGPTPLAPAESAGASPAAARGGFVAPVLGGVVAAVIGFGLSHYNIFGLRADEAAAGARFAELEARLDRDIEAAAAAGRAAAEQAGSAQEAADGKIAALGARIDAVDGQLAVQSEALPDGSVTPAAFAALKAEVDALRAAPAAAPDGAALRQQIEAELDARAGEAAREAEQEAEATRQAALRDAAWISLNEAVKNGQPYADALAALGATNVPQSLVAHAEAGLPSLARLAESFPDAARAALDVSLRADGSGGFGDRALSLLRVTTGARSLTPQEGTDPDAVLSRAEAAVQAGDLAGALSELQGLPAEGLAAMAEWSAGAQARIDAEAALAAIKP